jgi:hypothetical protein
MLRGDYLLGSCHLGKKFVKRGLGRVRQHHLVRLLSKLGLIQHYSVIFIFQIDDIILVEIIVLWLD